MGRGRKSEWEGEEKVIRDLTQKGQREKGVKKKSFNQTGKNRSVIV